MCIHISLPSPLPPPHPTQRGHHRALGGAAYAYRTFLLAMWFTHGSVFMSVLSPNSSHLSFPHVPTYCSPCLCLYSCPANRFTWAIFLDSTYMFIAEETVTLRGTGNCHLQSKFTGKQSPSWGLPDPRTTLFPFHLVTPSASSLMSLPFISLVIYSIVLSRDSPGGLSVCLLL